VSEPPVKILIVDDEMSILDSLQILFRSEGWEVAVAPGGDQAIEALDEERPDLVLSDIRMPGTTGLDVLAHVQEADPELPVILMTAQASLQSAVRAVNEGAYYYIQKPFANDELVAICRRAAEARQLKTENRSLKKEIRRRDRKEATRPIGKSRSFVEVLELAETVAPRDYASSTYCVRTEVGVWRVGIGFVAVRCCAGLVRPSCC
jgi:two-component system response regulator HydG